jgi:hypothetical protein
LDMEALSVRTFVAATSTTVIPGASAYACR